MRTRTQKAALGELIVNARRQLDAGLLRRAKAAEALRKLEAARRGLRTRLREYDQTVQRASGALMALEHLSTVEGGGNATKAPAKAGRKGK